MAVKVVNRPNVNTAQKKQEAGRCSNLLVGIFHLEVEGFLDLSGEFGLFK
jgi:hypothetical protein